MIRASLLTILLILTISPSQERVTISAFGTEFSYQPPAFAKWNLVQEVAPREGFKGVVMYKRTPIYDSLGRPVEPVIALLYEQVPDSMDAIVFSVNKLGEKPFTVHQDTLLAHPDFTSHNNSFGWKAHYTRSGVEHTIYLAYFRENQLGIEIITDSTTGVFEVVEPDMLAFIKSVRIENNNGSY